MQMTAANTTDATISRQWASRPADERYTSLTEMYDKLYAMRRRSASKVVASREINFVPVADGTHKGITVQGSNGMPYAPTHWSFGQMATLAGAPAHYLRQLPAEIAADCLNYGMRFNREIKDIGVLIRKSDDATNMGEMVAATGPNYGRVWNGEIVEALIDRFGNGVTGDFRVPGEFGQRVAITKDNTTLYAGDRDMFVFLADETNRVELPGRRDGKTGSLARGFYVSNSEVGAGTLDFGAFLFDYACSNRILWGVAAMKKIKIRHSKGAPFRYIEEVVPVIKSLAHDSAAPVEATLKAAQNARIDDIDSWLKNKRFTDAEITSAKKAFLADEGRDIATKSGATTIWDVVTGLTSHAKDIKWQNERSSLEGRAGALLDLVDA